MTVLKIVQDAMALMSLTPRPSSVIGSTSAQLQKLVSLSETGGEELAQSHPWQKLTMRRTFEGVTQHAQTGEPPEGFDRFPASQRIWDVTRKTWLIGPMSPNEWDAIAVRETSTYPGYWCILQGVINITPVPQVGDSYTYTWITRNWIRPAGAPEDGSADSDEWEDDADVSLLPKKLLAYDLVWRFKQAEGLDYAEDMSNFERKKEKAIARDRGPREITTTEPFNGEGPPDNFWPGIVVQ